MSQMGMKVEGLLFLVVVSLFAPTCFFYWYFSRDPIGTTALTFTVGMAFLISFFMLVTGRRIGRRPEDEPEGEVSEGAGQFGFYAPKSWWPLWVGLSITLAALGLAIGWWLTIIGLLCVVLSVIGMIFEFYRGVYSR